MGKFRQILTELSARGTPIFLFPDDNLRKQQGILTKLGTCIDIKEIWFGISNGQISSNVLKGLTVLDTPIFSFRNVSLSKYHGILTQNGTCIDIKEIWLGIANGQFRQFLTVIFPRHDNGGVSSFYVLITYRGGGRGGGGGGGGGGCGGRLWRRCRVSYVTGASNWYWLSVWQGLLSL